FFLNGSNQTLAGIQGSLGTYSQGIYNNTANGYWASTLTLNTATDYASAQSVYRDASGGPQYGNLKFVKQGAGRFLLGGYGTSATVGAIGNTGGIDVQGGFLQFSNTFASATEATSVTYVAPGTAAGTAVGTGFLNVATGATADLNGLNVAVDYLTGGGVITNTGTSARTLTIGDLDNKDMATGAAVSAIFSGVIADGTSGGTISLQKRGAGTQTLTAAQDFTAGFHILGGTLVLDMSGMANPNNLIRQTNGLGLAGNLTVKGAASGTSSQTFLGNTTVYGGASEVLGNANGGTLTITLGTVTRSVANATLNFTAGTNVSYKNTGTDLTPSGWITYVGASSIDWAISTSNVIGAYSGYTVGLPTSASTATVNYVDTSTSVTLTAGETINSLKLAPATTAQTIVLGANTLTFTAVATTGPAGLLFDGTNAASTITGTSAITTTVASGELVIYTGHTTGSGNPLTISTIIGGTNLTTVTKAGPDLLDLGSQAN
ncbi:MAG: hypothetical protein EBR99_06485, partial [Actinobacteria bacterium]|nr:hypothetical protein [Actinomycetota bacterium]